jgi:thymidylate synthase
MEFPLIWKDLVSDVLSDGRLSAPRGKVTKELLHKAIAVDMSKPVLTIPGRALNYRFMAAEAYWILSGDDSVAGIAPYNRNISGFSDDGEKFFGAYGPKIVGQLDYVVEKLKSDPDTRQAGLTIWRENPGPTKDIPCTVAIFFSLRGRKLSCHVFMRSSDIWLGVPYDVFNFSMLAHLVCSHLNHDRASHDVFEPGTLYLTAASSHLYEPNWTQAEACLGATVKCQPPTPKVLWNDHRGLLDWLKDLRETKPGHELRWWEGSGT